MALLLALETSTHSFSCALHLDGKLIAEEESISDQTTASMLAVMIEKLFEDAGVEKKQLNAVAVAAGPGSYTGLRIGVATAKGICYALDIPLVSVETLKLMAHQITNQPEWTMNGALLCPMLDARRMEVYCSIFDEELNVIQATQAKVIDQESFLEFLNRSILFFGEGSEKCREIIKHTNAKFISGIKPKASALGELGYGKFLTGGIEDLEHFEPFYLKDFIIIRKPNSVS